MKKRIGKQQKRLYKMKSWLFESKNKVDKS